jgi:hypothetical protein
MRPVDDDEFFDDLGMGDGESPSCCRAPIVGDEHKLLVPEVASERD